MLSLPSLSQASLRGQFSAGYAFNDAVYLNNERVHGANGIVFQGSGRLGVSLTPSFFVESGLAAKFVSASGKVRLSDYRSRTWRISVPIMAGLKISDDFSLLSGVSIQNNRDFSVFRAREKYNFRYDLVIQGKYRLSNRWSVTQSIDYNVHIPDAYLINDPRMALSVGVSYHFHSMDEDK